MQVGVGHSDNPESNAAGLQAVKMAILKGGRSDQCDMVLLFSTARHDQAILRDAVVSAVGNSVPIYGGGAVGVITNEYFGYAGDQVAVACIWLDGVACEALIEKGLNESEEEAGIRLGRRLAELGTKQDSPVMMFYDAFDCSKGVRMLMATWLLDGIKKGLGFFPDLTGAGMMGDYSCSPTKQWIGDSIDEHTAIALAFSGNIRIDSVIMHGCRPATQYYTVTKAAGQVILEINGKQAIQFIDELLDSAIAPEDYPFFLIFGINHGDRWGKYDEDYYASRLCLGIDKESGGIVMFEPDMVEGTEFQLMFRSLDLDYVKPKIDKVFNELDGREPVFAVYINCAGRCAGYGGMDIEDALVIQKTVADRVPVLGLYTGVEIASMGGRPRGLDWTGVFCLFSQSKDGGDSSIKASSKSVIWNTYMPPLDADEAPVSAMARIAEQNAAKILALDTSSIAIRCELEQKRRGFSLLSELSVLLRQGVSYNNVFIPVAKRINAALNMQRTVVLMKGDKGLFKAEVLQGYSAKEKAAFAERRIKAPSELFNPDCPVLVTGADPPERFKGLRELIGLPYFISTPVVLQGEVYAILITGRLVEAPPYLVRLNRGDMETVQAIGAFLASALAVQRLADAEERGRIMMDSAPIYCTFWDENGKLTDCSREMLSLFGFSNKKEFLNRFFELSPEYQPDGQLSARKLDELTRKAFVTGGEKFEWMHMTLSGELIPVEVTLIRVPKGENYSLTTYLRDLREQNAAQAKIDEAYELAEKYMRSKNEFIASVSHEIRTPMNAIQAMARVADKIRDVDENDRNTINNGVRSIQLLASAIETIVDFSKLDSGQLSLKIEKFSIRELIEGVGGILRKDAEEKSLFLKTAVDSDVPDLLLGDSVRLQHVLFNIVMNAIKFTETGGVDIRVSREKTIRNDEALITIDVRDTGIGIAEDQIDNLFTPLYSNDMAYDRRYSGMGMGLPVSNGLVALMGGKITCESRQGEGSIFRLIVPLTVSKEKTEEVKEKAAMLSPTSDILRGLRVLVAEDNKINQMIMEELLVSVGIEAVVADNGIEVLEMLEKDKFDIILMDIQMPGMDGLTAAAQIRADDRFKEIPILAMTANAGAEYFEESISAGMNDHLTKPVDPEQLYNALKQWRNYRVR